VRIPIVHGIIERRILANFQVDPDILAGVLPPPFRPKVVNGVGMAGICLIRLKNIKPQSLVGNFGFSSENAAHRIAVEWDENGRRGEGVFIPRRDTSSRLTMFVGGRLFPGFHKHARFRVAEHADRFRVALDSDDGKTHVLVDGRIGADLPATSTFASLTEASAFFEAGSVGYSVTPRTGEYDGLELRSFKWKVEPLQIENIESSYFENARLFPRGSVGFDCALIMRNIQHEWHGREPLCAASCAELNRSSENQA
jgi:uncharacterized protein YqjF (DUF2071 family)